ncbi:tRNA ligase 1-like isoform X3 [Trifolium pratense]|uniref:tRNA ligase 1-like isoform X3 n=1 Tax=Trifolium pratense TaxID=57577 RepID=UPI001E6929F0|nr:tRNA ligase 1-like isoform X3 [Trifolium pratense]
MIELVSKGLATLERNHRKHMCISMELVAAVLGDHGQRPHEDYVVATAVTELGNGKPKFYSTRDNLFLHKMAITNKSRVVVLNKKISLFLHCCL